MVRLFSKVRLFSLEVVFSELVWAENSGMLTNKKSKCIQVCLVFFFFFSFNKIRDFQFHQLMP